MDVPGSALAGQLQGPWINEEALGSSLQGEASQALADLRHQLGMGEDNGEETGSGLGCRQ